MRLGEKATCVWRPMVTLPELGASPPEIRREKCGFPRPVYSYNGNAVSL